LVESLYNRYLAEFKTGSERKDAAENTMVAYKAAQVICLSAFHSPNVVELCWLGHYIFHMPNLSIGLLSC
jgi:hypothetical protein